MPHSQGGGEATLRILTKHISIVQPYRTQTTYTQDKNKPQNWIDAYIIPGSEPGGQSYIKFPFNPTHPQNPVDTQWLPPRPPPEGWVGGGMDYSGDSDEIHFIIQP